MAHNRVIFGDETLIDISKDTVTPQTLAKGYTAHDANGEQIVGTMTSDEAPSGSGGEAVEEVFWVTCDLDPNTLSAFNFSHTYDEIMQAASEGKMVKGKGLVSGLPIEYLTFDLMYVGGYSGYITFSAFFRTPIQGQLVCLYINVRMLSDNTIDQDIMIVNVTNM